MKQQATETLTSTLERPTADPGAAQLEDHFSKLFYGSLLCICFHVYIKSVVIVSPVGMWETHLKSEKRK